MNLARVEGIASRFWEKVGNPEPFPRGLISPILNVLPTAIVPIRGLTVEKANEELRKDGNGIRLMTENRPLHGCVAARAGVSYLLYDVSDPPAERRFTVAHELAHLLLHYYHHRDRVERRLGRRGLDVLDGRAQPTLDDRIDAFLAGVTFGVFTHLLDRRDDGHGRSGVGVHLITEREREADQLAWEFLAPAHEIRKRVGANWPEDHQIATLLVEVFGLPVDSAGNYAHALGVRERPRATHLDWLRTDAAATFPPSPDRQPLPSESPS